MVFEFPVRAFYLLFGIQPFLLAPLLFHREEKLLLFSDQTVCCKHAVTVTREVECATVGLLHMH